MGRWIQLKDANWRVGYLGGWCEGFVGMAWGFNKFTYDSKGNVIGTAPNGTGLKGYGSATAHWQDKQGNHPGQLPPKGITAPVFFKLGNVPAGHVAIMLDDGYVASSTLPGFNSKGYLHKNIDDLIAMYGKYNGGCEYLGWSEYVSGVQVVKYEPTITTHDVTESSDIAFTSSETPTDTLPLGEKKVSVAGVNGTHTVVTRITYSDGAETGRQVISDTTIPPVNEVVLVGTYEKPVDPAPVTPEVPEVPKPTDTPVPGITPDEPLVQLKQIIRQVILAIIGWIKNIK